MKYAPQIIYFVLIVFDLLYNAYLCGIQDKDHYSVKSTFIVKIVYKILFTLLLW